MKNTIDRPKRSKTGGFIYGTYEVHYESRKKSWQIWHPEYGFMAAFRDKQNAVEHVKTLTQ